MGMKFSKEYEAELIARADKVSPSFTVNTRDCEPMKPGTLEALSRVALVVAMQPTWTFRVPDWHPTPVNKLYDHHWTKRRKHKQSDTDIVAHYGRNVPKADRKRSVSLHVVFPAGKRRPDPEALGKSLLDALVHAGILVNDSYDWARLEPPTYSRGDTLISFITVEDI